MAKKVLIIAYYWPPSSGSGVQRWLKFVKYFREAGWEPIVVTPENPSVNLVDNSLLADIPNGTQVLKCPIIEPFELYNKFMGQKEEKSFNPVFLDQGQNPSWKAKLAVWVRANLFIPDPRVLWARPASKFIINWLKTNKVDAMVTTGPPQSMHLVGLRVKQATGLPWIADFRDPWTNIDFFQHLPLTSWAKARHFALEKKVLNTADRVVVIGKTMQEEFSLITKKPIEVITNGFDESDIPALGNIKRDGMFSLVHVGVLGSARNHSIFWDAISELRTEFPDFAQDFVFRIYGKSDPAVEHSVSQYNAKDWVQFFPYLPHKEAVLAQATAEVLFLSINNTANAKGILTGKMFEYLAIGRPILAIGPVDGDAAYILNQTSAGEIAAFDDKIALKAIILRLYQLFKEGKLETKPEGISQFSRRNLTFKMADVLNQLILRD